MSRISRNYRPVKSAWIKLKNRRVIAGIMADGTVHYRFKRLFHGRIMEQEIRLSPEAIYSMFRLALGLGALDKIAKDQVKEGGTR